MAASHLARGIFSIVSPSRDLFPKSECVRRNGKPRTTVRARFEDSGGEERLKNGALSNYVPPFFPGYRDFSYPGEEIEVDERARVLLGGKRGEKGNARLAGESGVQDGWDLLRSGRRARNVAGVTPWRNKNPR